MTSSQEVPSTKSTKTRKKTPQEAKNDDLFATGEKICALWIDFRKYIRKSFSDQPVTMQEEQDFLELKSQLTRLQRLLGQRMPEGSQYGAHRMSDIMSKCISISVIRDLPLQDKKGLYALWHQVHIAQQRMLGILDLIREGHQVTFETVKAKSGNIKADFAASRKSNKKKDYSGVIKGIIALIVIAAVAYFVLGKK